jgi:hypothetical protein|tara:strand:+ start:449 stop:1096 length:648 start_codon:yes stop_codon:yes gene_type:complete
MTNQAKNIAIRGFLQLRQSPVFVLAVILFFIFRPEEGYIRRLEFIKFLIDNDHFFKNILTPGIIELLLPFIIIVPLIFYRKRVGTAIKGFMDSQMSKAVIEEFDKDGDDKLSKEEFQGFFEKASEDIEEEKKDFDSDALFDKHDSNKDGKLDGDEISSLILELFHVVRNEVTPSSGDEPVKVDSGKDEIQKLDRLYNEGYLSKERYERLKQDLSR